MTIDEQLKQGKFVNEFHRLRVNLLYSSNWVSKHICEFLEPYSITQQQFNILRILKEEYPKAISTLQIREKMIVSMSDTSRLVDRLKAKGLVEKQTCCKDKRLVDILISEKGLTLLEEIDKKIAQLDTVFELDEREARKVNELLNKMRKVQHHEYNC